MDQSLHEKCLVTVSCISGPLGCAWELVLVQALLLVHGGRLALLVKLLWQCLANQRQSVLLQAVLCKRWGQPRVCCGGVYCDNNGVLLERSDLYRIKLSTPFLNSYVVLKPVASISDLKRVLCQNFCIVFPTAAVGFCKWYWLNLKNLVLSMSLEP